MRKSKINSSRKIGKSKKKDPKRGRQSGKGEKCEKGALQQAKKT